MTVNFILNGEDVALQTEANTRLLDILRDTYKLMGTKAGCRAGYCGICYVSFNKRVIPSCLIPAFRIRGSEVITIEGFSQYNEYADITGGFSQAGLETCGYCDNAKILAAETLLEQNPQPSREAILAAFRGIKCRCTDPDALVDAVLAAAEIRERRRYGRAV